jgi:hypothetical protein
MDHPVVDGGEMSVAMKCAGWLVSVSLMVAPAIADDGERVCREAAALIAGQSSAWSVTVESTEEVPGGQVMVWTTSFGPGGMCRLEGDQVVAVALDGAWVDPAGVVGATGVGEGVFDGRLRCASDDGRRRECPLPAEGIVRLVDRQSRADCVEGVSWGVAGDDLWVDDGCRAEFELVPAAALDPGSGGPWAHGTWSGSYGVTCESDDGRRLQCALPAEGAVRLARQLSRARCVPGTTWGALRDAIWVDQGCRGEFEVVPGVPAKGVAPYKLSCASSDGRRRECRMENPGAVVLVRQLSRTECAEGKTWGVAGDVVWVDGGCRGEFEVRPPGLK